MKKKILISIVLLITFNVAEAQFGYGKIEDVKNIKEIPLLVLLESKNKKTVKRLSKKDNGALEQYYSQINQYNKALKKVFNLAGNFLPKLNLLRRIA